MIAACLLLAFSTTQLSAQTPAAASSRTAQQSKQISISGKIVDSKNEEVIGATIGLKGTSNGTISDLDGAFTLNNVPSDATLTVSYLGYKTQEIKINGKQVFNIILQEDATALDEVVVEVGYGKVKRANLLGAVSNMTAEDIKDIPTANLSETLYGRLAGVGVSVNNGTPGSSPRITVRKSSSYNAGTQEPLYIIDGIDRGIGVEGQSFFDILDPNDVESISVLKDASAAVYGARGAGGVVLVNTKKGKEGKAKLSYSGSFGISDRTSFPELMSGAEHARFINDGLDSYYGRNTAEFMNMSVEDFRTASRLVYDPANQIDNRGDFFNSAELIEAGRRNYDWLDKYWSSSTTTKHNISLSGGSKDLTYFTSLSYLQQDGNIGNFNIEQYSFRVGLEAKLVAGLKGSFSMDMNTKTKKVPFNRQDSSDGTMKSTFQSLMRTPRWMPYEVNGQSVFYQGMPESGNEIAHIAGIEDSYSKSKANNASFNIAFTYDFSHIKALEGLTAKVSYARTESNSRNRSYRVPYILHELAGSDAGSNIPSISDFAINDDGTIKTREIPNGNRFQTSSNYSQNYQFNLGINYSRTFDKKHNLHVMLNYEESQSRGDNFNVFQEGINIYDWEKYAAFGGLIDRGNGYGYGARRGYIGRLNYDYQGKYLVESAFRYEASHRFPKHSRWGFFPSGSVGWRISEEDWYKIDFMDSAKARISLGLVGDDSAISNQWRLSYGQSSTGGYLGDSPLYGIRPSLSGLANNNLVWETTFFSNYGVDLRFLNKIDFGFDFWLKNTWNILDQTNSNIPTTVGVGGSTNIPKFNYGAMKAWGYEVTLAYNGRINKDMTYRVGGNLSWSDNKIKKIIQSDGVLGTYKDRLGRRNDSGIEGLVSYGIVRTQDQLDAILEKHKETGYKVGGRPLELGMLYYKDTNKDGNIDSGDYERLEDLSSNPYSIGFNLGFTWKTLSFTAQFAGSFGGHTIMNKNDYSFPTRTSNGLDMWKNHWTLDNPNASMPRAYIAGSGNGINTNSDVLLPSTFWIKDGTELRLRNATISYSVPQSISSKAGVSNVRVFVTGTNLLTLISPYDYKDPQLSYFDSYPIMRTINFGLNFSL